MQYVELALILICGAAGAFSAAKIAWERRLRHVWPKRGEIDVVNPSGLWTGIAEVALQTRVIANRPVVGIAHMVVFYGFISFGAKSVTHVLNGLMGFDDIIHMGFLDTIIDGFAWMVLASVILLAYRRYFIMKERLTHPVESGLVLGLIATLMITYLLERGGLDNLNQPADRVNWWIHYLVLCGFPSLIAYGKHFHLVIGPVNVVLKHMTELPSDRVAASGDFDMGDEDDDDDEAFEAEYARVGMPNGVADFSFHTLLDPAACIECGRCNDVCPSADAGLKPREHFVLAFRDHTATAMQLAEMAPPDTVATCTQCRACDTVCPVGNRPSRAGLELRGRMSFAPEDYEHDYPPAPVRDGGEDPVGATGNIFGEDPSSRERFIEKNDLPIYDPEEHEVLFVLGCQGSYSPDAQHVVVATARLLEAAGVTYGVLEEETCWGEGLIHGGGLTETWPVWKLEKVEELEESLGGDCGRTILTICPHCKDTIGTQYKHLGKHFSGVVSHISFLADLVSSGKLKIEKQAEDVAVHHPCKTIHNDEHGTLDELLSAAGVTGATAGKSPEIPRCCGGGGGGFLWDSPAKVNRSRWDQIMEETRKNTVVTGCPGCHRMLAVAKDENSTLKDVANVLYERLPKSETDSGESPEA